MKNNKEQSEKYEISREILPLTSFRFLTAFIVFLFHLRIHFDWKIGIHDIDKFINKGAIFMSAFFVLSGFIMYYTYQNADFSSKKNLHNYYLKRLARIYPVYFIVSVLSLYTLFKLNIFQICSLVAVNIFLLQAFFYGLFSYWINGGMWSLSVEAFFYALFPFLKKLLDFFQKHKIKLAILFYIWSIFPSIIFLNFGRVDDLYVNPVFRLGEFCSGIITAMFFLENKDKISRNISRFCSYFITGLFLLLIISVNLTAKYMPKNSYTCFNFVAIPVFCSVIYFLALLDKEKNKISYKIFSNTVFKYLGQISYSFYMVQFLTIGLFAHKLNEFVSNIHLLALILFLTNIILSAFFYEVFETKLRYKLVKKYSIK